jgi:hypothetical protein
MAGAGLLAELVAVGVERDGDLEVAGRVESEEMLEVDLARGGVEEVGAAYDVGDLLGVVIDDGELLRTRRHNGARAANPFLP